MVFNFISYLLINIILDIIFLIYLYQRWIYPVDPNRIEGPQGAVKLNDDEQEQEQTKTLQTKKED
jgi:hypothetical protein